MQQRLCPPTSAAKRFLARSRGVSDNASVSEFLPGRAAFGEREPSRLSDAEFEALVDRSEALARSAHVGERPLSGFERLVADAIDRLPPEFQEVIEQVPVVVSNRGAEIHAYGEYYGGTIARDRAAHRIVIFQDTLERDFGRDPDLLRAQVERTLRHEVAHHLGYDERGVGGLGL
jgi:predicted Zn-dependent protease with MMP-like domain